jgi:hypothetical protein
VNIYCLLKAKMQPITLTTSKKKPSVSCIYRYCLFKAKTTLHLTWQSHEAGQGGPEVVFFYSGMSLLLLRK